MGGHNGEVDGPQVSGGVAVVEQQIAGGAVDGEGQGKPPIELQWEVACPDSNHWDDLQTGNLVMMLLESIF